MKRLSFAFVALCATLSASWVQDYITPIPDFPQQGVVFQWTVIAHKPQI